MLLNSYGQAAAIFVFVSCGAAVGMAVQRLQPGDHRDDASKDTVKLVMGLMATMTALILSLLIASAHSFYDMQRGEIQQLGADVLMLDATLSQYGSEADAVRARFHAQMETVIAGMSPGSNGADIRHETARSIGVRELFGIAQGLTPSTDAQRAAAARVGSLVTDIATTRLLIHEQNTTGWPLPLAVTLICWLTVLFLLFGLLAPFNATVVGVFLVGGISVSAAMLLMLSMSHPYSGFMRVTDAPLQAAVAQLGA
jgi:hypothetical protein